MKTILVVDDELSNAEVLSFLLTEEGFRVVLASNGRQGLDRVAETAPDLVILDYMMPVMDGAAMGKALLESTFKQPKIIMNSAMAEDVVRRQFSGYDAYLRKPYSIERLLAVIRELLP